MSHVWYLDSYHVHLEYFDQLQQSLVDLEGRVVNEYMARRVDIRKPANLDTEIIHE